MISDVHLVIKRQAGPDRPSRWEEFKIPYRKSLNVVSCLMEIQRHPVTASGEKTTPVAWEATCLEEVCGACSMLVNGIPRQACSARVDRLQQPIRLEPFSKFPVIRDLVVDRGRMFESLKKVRAWIPIDGTHDLGPGPRMSEKDREAAYPFSRCMSCGCCLEACPQVNPASKFMGPAAIGQVRLLNAHPTGRLNRDERLDALTDDDGIANCSNDQNCVQVCPQDIPLTRAIAEINRDLTLHTIFGWLSR